MFEKYDGVRGFWNPLKKAFYSRRGRELRMPRGIIDSMPSDLFLDGELWYAISLPLCFFVTKICKGSGGTISKKRLK